MQSITFKANDVKRGVPFAIIYLIALFLLLYCYFGGINNMATAAEGFGRPKALGFILAVVLLLPFFIILNRIMPTTTIQFHENEIQISHNKKPVLQIPYANIHSIQINHTNMNTVDILDAHQSILYAFRPQSKVQAIWDFKKALAQHIKLQESKGTKKIIGGSMDTFTYTRL